MTDLQTPDELLGSANAINSAGQVVGFVSITSISDTRACLFVGGSRTILGVLGTGASSSASGINDAGDIVGTSYTVGNTNRHAFLYSDGEMTDLNDLIDPSCGWILQGADDINDLGQIIGFGSRSGYEGTRAFLLTPVPEPATVGLLTAGLGALLTRRKRR